MPPQVFRPILALTMGDPVGVGPDVLAMALKNPGMYAACRPLVLGDLPALSRACSRFAPELTINPVQAVGEGRYEWGAIDLMALSKLPLRHLECGLPTPAGGAAMVAYILKAVDLALAEEVAGIVTGPISKLAMNLAGYKYPGHTELLADKTGAPDVVMMLAGGEFRVVLATIHCALAEVPGRLNTTNLVKLMHLTSRSLNTHFGLTEPHLGVAALNPHAGEGGLFGREEEQIIIPAVRQARAQGLFVDGPFPADTLFWRHRHGEFAAILCMYHDQGLIPLKLLHFMDAVNVTLGLPIIRTSVDHGTAYDLAGTGKAHPDSLMAAILMAADMARRQRLR